MVLLRLVAEWRQNYQNILECAESNKKLGDHWADSQLRAQAFGVKICADALEALVQHNDWDQV